MKVITPEVVQDINYSPTQVQNKVFEYGEWHRKQAAVLLKRSKPVLNEWDIQLASFVEDYSEFWYPGCPWNCYQIWCLFQVRNRWARKPKGRRRPTKKQVQSRIEENANELTLEDFANDTLKNGFYFTRRTA